MAFEKDPNELGALWAREGRKGPYLSGKVGDLDVICFPISKGGPKAPQWRVMKSTPREERHVPAPVDDSDIGF